MVLYSELTRLTCGDYNPDSRTLAIKLAKGDIRHVVLTDDADRCFATWTAGKAAQGKCIPAFQRHLLGQVAAGAAARDCEYLAGCELPRATAAYGRHLAMQGVPFGVIARELGHSIRG